MSRTYDTGFHRAADVIDDGCAGRFRELAPGELDSEDTLMK
jgi:hypothetical protein